MKRNLITLSALIILASCNSDTKTDASSSSTKDTTTAKTDETYAPVDTATVNKAWGEFMTPGPMHQLLASQNGTWDGDLKMWMAPGAPPMEMKGVAVNKMIYDGRYQEAEHSGNMGEYGQFIGKAITGYDNAKKKFYSSWIDNMGTGIMLMEGDYDSTTKTFTFTGKMTNFVNGKDCTIRQTVQVIDDKNQLMKMWGPDLSTGKEFQTMEAKLTKRG